MYRSCLYLSLYRLIINNFKFTSCKYHTDHNFNPSRGVGFMSVNPGTSGRLHSEFIRIFLLQTHRETDRFFTVSGVWSRDVNFWVENTISKTTIPQSPTPPSFCVNEKVIGKREYGVDVWNRIIKCKFSFV